MRASLGPECAIRVWVVFAGVAYDFQTGRICTVFVPPIRQTGILALVTSSETNNLRRINGLNSSAPTASTTDMSPSGKERPIVDYSCR